MMRPALPALFSVGASIFSGDAVMKWLNLAIGAVALGAGSSALRALDDEVKKFIAEGRDPRPDEWAALAARSALAHDKAA